jgi:hypothetical protein
MERILIRKGFLFTEGSVCHLKLFATKTRNSLKNIRKPGMMPNLVALLSLRQEKELI